MPLLLATAADPGSGYWVDSSAIGGLAYWTEDGSGNLTPDADGTQDIGSAAARVDRITARQAVLVDGTAAAVDLATGPGGETPFLGVLNISGDGTETVTQYSTAYYPPACTLMAGNALTLAAGATANMESYSAGGIVAGLVSATGTSTGQIKLGYYGNSLGGGFALGNVTTEGNAVAGVEAYCYGYATNWAMGNVWAGTGATSNVGIRVTAPGALARGNVGRYGYPVTSNTARVRADGVLSTAIGFVQNSGGQIRAGGYVTLAQGYVKDGSEIKTSNIGSMAFGCAYNSYDISASGNGSMAFGFANGASILASASNSFQFGEGGNGVANSLQVGASGAGIHLHGAGAPGAPGNGDIWVANNYTYIRSNGVSVKIT